MPQGRPPTVSDEDILRAIDEHEDPFVFTSDVQEALEFSTPSGMYRRLDQLRKDGYVDSKGDNALIWWLTEAGENRLQGDD